MRVSLGIRQSAPWLVAFVFVCGLAAPRTAGAATIQIGSQQDASIADNVNSATGSSIQFLINWAGANSSMGLIQFDLSAIPSSAVILSATLDLFHQFNSGNGNTYNFYRNTSAWSEGSTTYATAPTYDPTSVSSLLISDTNQGVHRFFDLTAVTQGWVSGAFANNGLTLIQSPDDPNWIYFMSKEAPTEADRPLLTIDYRAPAAVPEPATLTLLGTGLTAVLTRRRRSIRKAS